ncbi:hypothetical protein N665_1004s0010 [Sinapis alba]|nr:hypothetical protein N665_1004s0010 [Sinapis alba]
MSGLLKDRFFSKLLGERHGISLRRFLEAINRRHDITDVLRSLKCRTLIFVGDQSPFHSETLHMHGGCTRQKIQRLG